MEHASNFSMIKKLIIIFLFLLSPQLMAVDLTGNKIMCMSENKILAFDNRIIHLIRNFEFVDDKNFIHYFYGPNQGRIMKSYGTYEVFQETVKTIEEKREHFEYKIIGKPMKLLKNIEKGYIHGVNDGYNINRETLDLTVFAGCQKEKSNTKSFFSKYRNSYCIKHKFDMKNYGYKTYCDIFDGSSEELYKTSMKSYEKDWKFRNDVLNKEKIKKEEEKIKKEEKLKLKSLKKNTDNKLSVISTKTKSKSQNQCQGNDSKQWHNCFGTKNLKHGATHTGYFMNGKPEGQGTFKAPNGHQYVGNYKNGTFHGKGTMNYPNGGKYVGMWKEGVHHGQGSLTYYTDGKYTGKFIGEFRNGKSHQGKIIAPDGREIIIDAEKLNQYKKEVQQ